MCRSRAVGSFQERSLLRSLPTLLSYLKTATTTTVLSEVVRRRRRPAFLESTFKAKCTGRVESPDI